MTLLDLVRLLRRYLSLCIILPIVFALATAGFMLVRGQSAQYTANAYIVAGTAAQLSTLNGTASSAARDYASSNPGYSATAKAETASLTVTITASGPDASGAANAANEVANAAVESAKELLGKDSVSASIQQASQGTRASGSSMLTYILVAILAGLFAAVCIVVAIDAVRRPVKGSADLETASGLPVLGELPGDTGERLLANARFASGKQDPRTVLIVPVKEGDPAALTGMLIDRAARSESPEETERHGGPMRVSTCAPLLQGVAAAYQARESDAVLIACAQWADSRRDVESTASELKLAGANAVGCVLVKDVRRGAKRGRRHAR